MRFAGLLVGVHAGRTIGFADLDLAGLERRVRIEGLGGF